MELQLKKIVEEFNKSRYGSGDSGKLSGEDTNPIGKVSNSTDDVKFYLRLLIISTIFPMNRS